MSRSIGFKLIALALSLAGGGADRPASMRRETCASTPPDWRRECSPACALALYSIFNKRAVARYNAWTVTTYKPVLWHVFYRPFPVSDHGARGWGRRRRPGPTSWAWRSGRQCWRTGLYVTGLAHVPASNASILATWEPATAMILAYLVLGRAVGRAATARRGGDCAGRDPAWPHGER